MVRVQVIGDSAVMTAPLRRALTAMPGVELLDRQVTPGPATVDTVVIDQSLGTGRIPDGLLALTAVYPGASFLVLSLDRGDAYRWVHVEPEGASFHVLDAGTGSLSAILSASLAAATGDRQAARHATVPAIPCSTA